MFGWKNPAGNACIPHHSVCLNSVQIRLHVPEAACDEMILAAVVALAIREHREHVE